MKPERCSNRRAFRRRSFFASVIVTLCWALLATATIAAAPPTSAASMYAGRAMPAAQVGHPPIPDFVCEGGDRTLVTGNWPQPGSNGQPVPGSVTHCGIQEAIYDTLRLATVLNLEEARFASEIAAISKYLKDPYGDAAVGNVLGITDRDVGIFVDRYTEMWENDPTMFGTNQTISTFRQEHEAKRAVLLSQLQALTYGAPLQPSDSFPAFIDSPELEHCDPDDTSCVDPRCDNVPPALCGGMVSGPNPAEWLVSYYVEAMFALTAGEVPRPDTIDEWNFFGESEVREVLANADDVAVAATHAFLHWSDRVRVERLEQLIAESYPTGTYRTLVELSFDTTARAVLSDPTITNDGGSVRGRSWEYAEQWGRPLRRLIHRQTDLDPFDFIQSAATSTTRSNAVVFVSTWTNDAGEAASGPAGAMILFAVASLGSSVGEARQDAEMVAMFEDAFQVDDIAVKRAAVRALALVISVVAEIEDLGPVGPSLTMVANLLEIAAGAEELSALQNAKLMVGIIAARLALAGLPIAWLFVAAEVVLEVIIHWPAIIAQMGYEQRIHGRIHTIMQDWAITESDFIHVATRIQTGDVDDLGNPNDYPTSFKIQIPDGGNYTFRHYRFWIDADRKYYFHRDYQEFLRNFLGNSGQVQAAVVTYPTHDQHRAAIAQMLVGALESYAADKGTYLVSGGGWKRGGQGWLNAEAGHYTKSITNVLVDGGWLNRTAPTHDPAHVDHSAISRADFMVYRCANRVAVFAKTDSMPSPPVDRQWWDGSGCLRAPIDAYEHGYVALSRPLCDKLVANVDMLRGERAGNGHDVIVGTSGNDPIIAGGGNDRICAGAGNDIIFGGTGLDRIWGEAGDDQIVGGASADTIYGGFGADKIWGETGNDFIAGNQDDDVLYGGPGNDTIHGGYNNDVVYGEDGHDTIINNRGNDEMHGGSGNDRITGGRHNDEIWGDAGNDTLNGGGAFDTLHGGDGADSLNGSTGNDRLFGGAHNDTLHGSTGDDYLDGSTGDDRSYGGDGADSIIDPSGTNYLHGGEGNDHIQGGTGVDTIHGLGGDDTIVAGGGNDKVYAGFGNDQIWGQAGNDFLAGNQNDDTILGGPGNDELHGGYDNDLVYGEAGNDKLVNNRGNDRMDGGSGTDTCQRGNGTDTLISC